MGQPNASLMKTGASSVMLGKQNASLTKYVGKCSAAICQAISMWQMQARFTDLKINSITAIGTPGCLKGPALGGLIGPLCPRMTEWERKMSDAVAAGVGAAWSGYQRSVTVPGLPWYPAFAAWPGPMAPPTPNVPTPLLALPQQPAPTIANAIRDNIEREGSKLAGVKEVASAISTGFLFMFPIWVAGITIKNVLGKGPVPSFAPPYVPVGPVVMGDNIPTPGHLIS